LSAGQRDIQALKGWRRKVFGEDALRLCNGEIGLTAKGNEIKVIEL
jgi:ribonuclease D